MFKQLVDDVASLTMTSRDFLLATPQIKKNIVRANINANALTPTELSWLIKNNFVTPSAELAHAAIKAQNVKLFGVVVDKIKRGWEDVFPMLFYNASFSDLCAKKRRVDLEILCRKLETYGIGASSCSNVFTPEACSLLRSVRWRLKVKRMSPEELKTLVTASPHDTTNDFLKHAIKKAEAALQSMLNKIEKEQKDSLVDIKLALQWVKSVALRRSTRPTHSRFFKEVIVFGASGLRCSNISTAMCNLYSEAYIGSAHPSMFLLANNEIEAKNNWSGFDMISRAKYVVAWPGPLQLAFSAMQHEREDWFASALCMLPPKKKEGTLGWREEANLAGRRIALCVLNAALDKVSPFWTTAITLMIASGHGANIIGNAALNSPALVKNLRYVWGNESAADVLAAYANDNVEAERAIIELLKCQSICGNRKVPSIFLESQLIERIPFTEYRLMFAKRLKKPILQPKEIKSRVIAAICLIRCGIPTELVSEILKLVRRFPSDQIDKIPLSMGATRLGAFDIVF